MNTNDVNQALKGTPCFKGTYPRDMLPEISKKPYAIVANTDLSANSGQHWVEFYFGEDNTAEYFDPYWLPTLYLEFSNYLYSNARYVFYSNTTLQSLSVNSKVCGNYCVLFLKLRCNGISFCKMLSLFSNNQSRNDLLVKAYTK